MQADPASDPEVRELIKQSDTLLQVGVNYVVANVGEYEVAGVELQRVKSAQKRLKDLRKTITRPIDAAKKAVMDLFRTPEEKLTRAESGIKRAMIGFQQEQDRKRREEQARADETARKEREKLEARAREAAAAGKDEKAAQLEQRASAVVAPVISREPPKVVGIQTREVWKFEVVDAAAVPREYLMVDEKKLGQIVRAMKGETKIPGVRVWPDASIAAAKG